MIRRYLACRPPEWDWRSWSYLLLVSEIGWAWKMVNHVCLRHSAFCEDCGVRRLDCRSCRRPWNQGRISVRVLYFIFHLSNSFCSSPVWGRDIKASRGAYWREGSGMAVSLGWSEAKSFHAVSAVGRMGMVLWPKCLLPHGCLAAFFDDDAALAGAAGDSASACAQLDAESRNCQARVGPLRIRCPSGHQDRAFVARGHELRCGMLWSPRFAVERLRRPAQRTTSSKVRIHQLLGTTTSAPARARLCCRACCPTHSAETGRKRSNSLMINRSGARFFCCVTQLCLHPASVDMSACFGVNWMETLDAVSNIVPRVFTCVRRGTPSLGPCQRFPLSSLLSPLCALPSPPSLIRVLRKVTRWRQLRATHSPISCTREAPEPG